MDREELEKKKPADNLRDTIGSSYTGKPTGWISVVVILILVAAYLLFLR